MILYSIYVFCPSVHGFQNDTIDVCHCQAYLDTHGIIFNCSQTVCMTYLRLRVQKAQSPHY